MYTRYKVHINCTKFKQNIQFLTILGNSRMLCTVKLTCSFCGRADRVADIQTWYMVAKYKLRLSLLRKLKEGSKRQCEVPDSIIVAKLRLLAWRTKHVFQPFYKLEDTPSSSSTSPWGDTSRSPAHRKILVVVSYGPHRGLSSEVMLPLQSRSYLE